MSTPYREGVIIAVGNLGAVASLVGDLEGAGAAYREALGIARGLGYWNGIENSLEGLGAVAAGRGAWARAARLGGAAEALREQVGAVLELSEQRLHDGYTAKLREALEHEVLEREWERGRAMTLDEAIEAALDE